MLNLAIECSGIGGSIAVFEGDAVLAMVQLPAPQSSVQTLSQGIDELLKPLSPRLPEMLSVTVGPGSFTGLRVGLATAKMLAWAWGVPVAAVDTLAVVAWRAARAEISQPPVSRVVIPVINAFRKQVFAGAWQRQGAQFVQLAAAQVIDAATWQRQPVAALAGALPPHRPLTAGGPPPLITGPGLSLYPPTLQPAPELAPPEWWQPRATEVGELGWQILLAGQTTTAHDLRAHYVRASAAEEKQRTANSTTAPGLGQSPAC